MLSCVQRVTNGVALLDANVPGWMDKIDPNTLNIGDDEECVVAQLFGSFNEDLRKGLGLSRTESELYGFYVLGIQTSEPVQAKYADLTRAWKTYLASRHCETVEVVNDDDTLPKAA